MTLLFADHGDHYVGELFSALAVTSPKLRLFPLLQAYPCY
jgi:hypothetical protein